MKKIGIYLIISIIIILLRENIAYFYGNALGVFKLDNNYLEGVIKLKDEKIKYLENELDESYSFNKFLDNISYNYKISKVLYKYPYKEGKYRIKHGLNDKVNKGMAVVNEYGFIGKIVDVDNISSDLLLLTHLKDVSVVVNSSFGKMNYDEVKNSFVISDISNYDKVYVNDEVYTSGYGSIKERLYIGKVIRVDTLDYEKRVIVESSVNFNNINYCLIVGDTFDS